MFSFLYSRQIDLSCLYSMYSIPVPKAWRKREREYQKKIEKDVVIAV